jgi:hypothetical protein
VREAARLRLALLADPAVRRLEKIIKHGEDAQALAAIKVVLDRNELYGFGVEHEAPAQVIAVQTQVNVPAVRVASMSDAELANYIKLLDELRELVPAEGNPRPYRERGDDCRHMAPFRHGGW